MNHTTQLSLLRQPFIALAAVSLLAAPAPALSDVWWPGWKRAGHSFVKNIKSPVVWGSAAGAVIFSATNADESVSEWAIDNTPIFGSPETANDWGTPIRTLSMLAAAGTALAVPANEDTGKIKRLLVNGGSYFFSNATVRILKENIDKTRPNGGSKSFPS